MTEGRTQITARDSLCDARYWKLYRDERKKLVKAREPSNRKPFQAVLSPQEITHVARTARKRRDAES